MNRYINIALALCVGVILSGCTEMVPVKQTEIAFELDDDGQWLDRMYSGEVIYLASNCKKHCNDAHLWESHQMIVPIASNYAMPQSNDMDLGLGVLIKVTLNKKGGSAAIKERLMAAAKRYPYHTTGEAYGDNQIFRTSLASIVAVDLNKALVKSKLRPVLKDFELSEAFLNISQGGSIMIDGLSELRGHLVAINSPLEILEMQVETVTQPKEIMDKKKAEEALTSSENMQKRQLAMKSARMASVQLIRLKEAANELELLDINAEFMTDRVLAYKWIQVAAMFAENGLPFAVDPSMLTPALSKLGDMSIDTSRAKAKLAERIAEVETEVENAAECAENGIDGECK
jgi:hypothetical protein